MKWKTSPSLRYSSCPVASRLPMARREQSGRGIENERSVMIGADRYNPSKDD